MHVTITSDSSEEVVARLRAISVALEKALNGLFAERSYGPVERFLAVLVAVYSDSAENNRIARLHEKAGSYKHPISGERVSYVSVALPIDPHRIENCSINEAHEMVCDAFLRRLDIPIERIPNKFNCLQFVEDLKLALVLHSKSFSRRS